MTYPTHKQYSVSFAFITSMLLYKYSMTTINYFLAVAIILMSSKYGALFPDLDHSWRNVKEKTVPNWIINKLIHATGGKHRSWQTHSIDIVIIVTTVCYMAPNIMLSRGLIDVINKEVLNIILLGFCSGWISHIIADMSTSAGVRLFCWNKKIIKFVPNHIGKLKFNTGNEWEDFVCKCVRVINIFLGLACIIYPFLMDKDLAKFIMNTLNN